MDNEEIAAELRDLRKVLNATAQGTVRKRQRVEWLNDNQYDFGEERVRLDHLQPDFAHLRCEITDTIKQIKKGGATGEEALELYWRLAKEVEWAQATLDDIRVPKLPSVWAAERRNAY